ncbi:hypothetical protein Mcup_0439 [Metallosphaera cuprina Ar-4]|uniref:Uncharacterized protein n=1 Tax=Metallosphaera cuprina (strain Ar-4) TaxID=1006006 RepID=F4G048_METCR|nr:hypothetical protein Mcup_0439 [Metallosphaera cuprina Ar-4]
MYLYLRPLKIEAIASISWVVTVCGSSSLISLERISSSVIAHLPQAL